MTEQTIYFDIDNTLVDTRKLIANCRRSVANIGVLSINFDQAEKTYLGQLQSSTEFNPDDFLAVIASYQPDVDPDELAVAFWLAQNFSEALFPEVLAVLTKLSPHCVLGIFSQGNKNWQRRKLRKTGLGNYFDPDHIIIAGNKLLPEVVALLEKNAIVVDDKPEVVAYLKQNSSTTVKPIHINRIDRRVASLDTTTISSLEELSKFFKPTLNQPQFQRMSQRD